MSVRPLPRGFHTAIPYLVFDKGVEALEFYKEVFGATELCRLMAPEGRLGHAEMRLGDSVIILAQAGPDSGERSARTMGGSPMSIYLYVDDADEFCERAVAAGAIERKPVEDQFYGDRCGLIEDPFGYTWWIATHVEDVSPEEMTRRMQEMFAHRR